MDKLREGLEGLLLLLIGYYILRGVFQALRWLWRQERDRVVDEKAERLGLWIACSLLTVILILSWVNS